MAFSRGTAIDARYGAPRVGLGDRTRPPPLRSYFDRLSMSDPSAPRSYFDRVGTSGPLLRLRRIWREGMDSCLRRNDG